MSDENRHQVPLTEVEIDAMVATIGNMRLQDIHPCRIKAVHTGLSELKDVQAKIRIDRE